MPPSFERLPWFQCYPTKLLGALAEMPADEGYLYTIIILRIYDVRGPITDNVKALSRRTGFSMKRTERCLQKLLESGKLITADGLISNPHAERFMSDQIEKQSQRKQKAKSAANVRWGNTEQNQSPEDANALPDDANKEKEKEKEGKKEKMVQKENPDPVLPNPPEAPPKRSRADRATRIPEDWKLTPEMGNYGRSRGLHHREVLNEAEKFVRYWKGKGGERGRKVDWKSTWENWCISAAERLGRVHSVVVPSDQDPSLPENFPRKDWEFNAMLYKNTSNWRLSWGPEPGPRCKMPADLQKQFISEPTPLKPPQGLAGPSKSSGGVGAGFLKELTSDAIK